MSNKPILIVDDEAQIRDAFKMVFEQVGYSTEKLSRWKRK